jgi:hypothetical protein
VEKKSTKERGKQNIRKKRRFIKNKKTLEKMNLKFKIYFDLKKENKINDFYFHLSKLEEKKRKENKNFTLIFFLIAVSQLI